MYYVLFTTSRLPASDWKGSDYSDMERFLGRFAPYIYALLRIVCGLMFACHGLAHLFGVFDPTVKAPSLASMLGVGGVIELVCGLLLALGLFGGWAAFLCSGQMAVAYFTFHAPRGFFPITNGGEPSVLYCFIFLLIACRGSGVLSIDKLITRRFRDTATLKFDVGAYPQD
jgi:putative oxidoreductase